MLVSSAINFQHFFFILAEPSRRIVAGISQEQRRDLAGPDSEASQEDQRGLVATEGRVQAQDVGGPRSGANQQRRQPRHVEQQQRGTAVGFAKVVAGAQQQQLGRDVRHQREVNVTSNHFSDQVRHLCLY